MKLIKLLTLILFSLNVYSQDSIRVIYGKNTSKWFTVPEKGIQLNLKRRNYATLTRLAIEVKLQSNSEAYKRNIELTGDKNNFTYSVNESEKKGRYVFTLSPVKKMLLKQKKVTVALLQNPANRRSMMPSKRTLLAEITFN